MQKKEAGTNFALLCQSRNMVAQFIKSLIPYTNQDSTLSHTNENWKIFNITSKYFSFFNNKLPASQVVYITREFSYMLFLFILVPWFYWCHFSYQGWHIYFIDSIFTIIKELRSYYQQSDKLNRISNFPKI